MSTGQQEVREMNTDKSPVRLKTYIGPVHVSLSPLNIAFTALIQAC